MRSHLTYANVVATLALCLAVGGGSAYAATKLAKNSVGSKQIRNHTVALKDLAKSVTGGTGANGAGGLQGPKGDAGPAGPAGATGAAGAAGKDLSFNGVRLGKLDRYPAAGSSQQAPEIPLGKAGSADILAKCYLWNGTVHSEIFLRRAAGATGGMLVFGGTDTHGFTLLKPGATYDLYEDFYTTHEVAAQWAATVTEVEGSTYDVRGLVYRQYAANALVAPASESCVFPQAQVENATR